MTNAVTQGHYPAAMAIFGKRRDREQQQAEADNAPRTLLDESSPYGSRRILVATNGTETWAQLFDGGGRQVTALWLAAHRGPAPDIQLSVPPEATRNPSGRPPFGHVEAVWFEEGDGVALFDTEGILAVLPGWAGPETLPGYAREAVAPSPSAAPLHNAVDQFGPRVERARGYWAWRNRPEAWQEYLNDAQNHLTGRLGPAQQTVPLGEGNPFVLAARHGSADEHLAVTVGMSGQRMPAVEQFVDDPTPYARIELAVAGLGAENADFVLLRWLARHPWRAATWIGNGHTVRWPGQGFPAGAPFSGVLLLDDPTLLPGPPAPDLSGHAIFGDPVRYLWLVPITDDDLAVAKTDGRDRLLARLRAAGRSWVAGDAGKPAKATPTPEPADDDAPDAEDPTVAETTTDTPTTDNPDGDDAVAAGDPTVTETTDATPTTDDPANDGAAAPDEAAAETTTADSGDADTTTAPDDDPVNDATTAPDDPAVAESANGSRVTGDTDSSDADTTAAADGTDNALDGHADSADDADVAAETRDEQS
ncbi:MAG: hypothetical protein GEV07_23380 [Streptosporangiales bacterium]|nr:hypothetical protein [Streptosporangiales bacterium]